MITTILILEQLMMISKTKYASGPTSASREAWCWFSRSEERGKNKCSLDQKNIYSQFLPQVDQLVMEVIDEQTQEDDEGEGSGEEDEDDEEEEEEEKPKKKAPAKKAPKRKATPSGSEGSEPESDEDSEEERAPSDGGGSDYEPDEPVKISRGKWDLWQLVSLTSFKHLK